MKLLTLCLKILKGEEECAEEIRDKGEIFYEEEQEIKQKPCDRKTYTGLYTIKLMT